jgi:hypothetical protein
MEGWGGRGMEGLGWREKWERAGGEGGEARYGEKGILRDGEGERYGWERGTGMERDGGKRDRRKRGRGMEGRG